MTLKWGLRAAIAAAVPFSIRAAVPESDFYPIIEYWKAGDFRANQLCEGEGAAGPPSTKASSYGFRTSLGLKDVAGQLLQTYSSSVKSLSTKDMTYAVKQRRKQTTWDALLDSSIKGAVASERGQPGSASVREQLCAAFDGGVSAEAFCYAMGNFSQSAGCLSNYEYTDRGAVTRELNPASNFGFTEVDASCFVISPGKNAVDLPLQQFAYTPDEIDRSTAQSEERIYFAMWKALDKLQRYAEFKYLSAVDQLANPSGSAAAVRGAAANLAARRDVGIHDLFRDNEIFDEILPGWKVERVFDINEPRYLGGPTLRTPYAALASKGDNLLIVLRRPLTTYDERLALYNQQSFKYLYNFTGEVHDGSSTIFQTLSGVVEFAVGAFYDARKLQIGRPAFINVIGGELPSSGAALILGSHLERVMTDRYGSGAVKVNVVTFGTTAMSDRSFVDKIRKSIEVRTILVQGDSGDLFPCSKSFSCDERILLPRTGIETGIEYLYAPLPGQYVIPINKLGRLNAAWADESAVLQLAAIKDCAYSCYLAATVCPSDPEAAKCDPQHCESFLVF